MDVADYRGQTAVFGNPVLEINPLKTQQLRRLVWIAVFALAICLGLLSTPVLAQSPGQPGFNNRPPLTPSKKFTFPLSNSSDTFIQHTTDQIYKDIAAVEQKLYGRAYWDKPLKKRFKQIEKTLFGKPQKGRLEERFVAIKATLKDTKIPHNRSQQHAPLISYLEKKLFQQTYENLPFERRVSQLESHVFARTFESYPIDLRIKKLTYTIPITAKEIRLHDDSGTTIASTRNQPITPTQPRFIPAASSNKPSTPLVGHYLENVFRQSNGSFIRWMKLPMKVYAKNANETERRITAEALSRWQSSFSLTMTNAAYDADVFVDWNRAPTANQPITRPILQVDNNQTIRTVILVDMTAYKSLPHQQNFESSLLRGLMHQLGHAAGLWGHSSNPSDIMYPTNRLESTDIPKNWNRRSNPISDLARVRIKLNNPQPSQRDRNTLTQVYSHQGMDLKTYSPYH